MDSPSGADGTTSAQSPRSSRKLTRVLILVRRVHMYAGLFLLPWVFLYGITGAMFNHYGLFADARLVALPDQSLAGSEMDQFPTTEDLANRVTEALQAAAPGVDIARVPSSSAEFVNDLILQVDDEGMRHAVHINPVDHSAWVASSTPNQNREKDLLEDINSVSIEPSPYGMARSVVPQVLSDAGIETDATIRPMGWCKLNFLATVDGRKARVTYVLRDGHVDVTEFTGAPAMSMRGFFLRLHTTHGQPPHWNGRMIWSVFVDVMAVAMVLWGVSGIVMWWQVKRTRRIGGIVLVASVMSGLAVYFSVLHFYATTRL